MIADEVEARPATSLVEILQNHVEYDAWATSRLLDAADRLTLEQRTHDFGTADKSVQGTLVHLLRAKRMWLRRMEEGGARISWGVPEDEDWPSLRAKWDAVHRQWKEWADVLGDSDASGILEYTDLKGQPWAQPIWQIVLHAVNHGTHHRGQVSGFLRACGAVPPPLDFIAFARQKQRDLAGDDLSRSKGAAETAILKTQTL